MDLIVMEFEEKEQKKSRSPFLALPRKGIPELFFFFFSLLSCTIVVHFSIPNSQILLNFCFPACSYPRETRRHGRELFVFISYPPEQGSS